MTLQYVLLLAAFGVFVGVFAGLLGVGGGIFMVPFLVLVGGLGQHEAQATSLLVVLPTAVVASVTLHRKGVGNLRVALAMGVLGAAGASGGALLALALPDRVLRVLFAALLAYTGIRLAVRTLRTPPATGAAGPR